MTDLPWLRRRARPPQVPSPALADFLGGRTTVRPGRNGPTETLDLAAPRPAQVAHEPSAFASRRTHESGQTVLTTQRPTVVLNRLQSGIGTLRVDAPWPAAHEVWLGCAYQLRSGRSSVLRRTGRARAWFGPLAIDQRTDRETLTVDLYAARHLERMVLFGLPATEAPPQWSAMATVTTYGGARVELPTVPPVPHQVSVLMSAYNIAGELVLRAELDNVAGPLREACVAHGFDRIAWRDPANPV